MNGAGAFDKYASVASSFAPVILAQFLVPTLDASYGREFRSVVSLPIRPNVLERHFVFSRGALERGRWWTAASYMLLHVDHAHAMANLQGLMLSGPAALDVLGGVGAMLVYVTAGVCAALDPAKLTDLQLERRLRARWSSATAALSRRAAPVLDALGLDPAFLEPPKRECLARDDRGFGGVGDALGDALASAAETARRTLDLGSSALDDTASTIARNVAKTRARQRRSSARPRASLLAVDLCASLERLAAPRRPASDDAVLHALLHAVGALRYFAGEVNRAWTGNGLEGVDHAAHLNGALVGVAFAVVGRAPAGTARGPRAAPAAATRRRAATFV
ncbi:hypothetical protein JL721_8545 [Aureococcus anophagefferens]|nr:hypothetical protein JL721_8545 [Aureococcus anophagefferens]